ncbi:Nitrogen regulatory protein P-II [Thiovulum sp. ES]|nr:Nitrogen regulatory protein P-II [Thiovulum sp. ES]
MQFSFFLKLLKESFRDLLPIIFVILFFQLAIIQTVPEGWESTAIGLLIVGVGLAIFLQGLEIGIFPVGESLARDFATKGSTFWVLLFGFMIGFGTTIAEPALSVIAEKAAAISSGRIDANMLRYVVAGSVGLAILLGVYRIIKGHPIHYYIIAGYILVVGVTFFTPHEIVGLAYDLGGVTTSTVTVPLVAALGIGLASSIKGRNPVIDGFGLIAFASLTPMIFVQVYGIYVYQFAEVTEVANAIQNVVVEAKASEIITITPQIVVEGILNVVTDVLPIVLIILFFQYGVIRKNINNIVEVATGIVLVILGLYAFILGLEMGLFSLGETMALQLTKEETYIIYSFAFAIGFSTTMAEPALMAIAKKAKEVSDGKINDLWLRIFVAAGVAIGIALGSYRIVSGDFIHYYIMIGYLIVIILTVFAPKYIIPIAYDSGGVTTSTVTVPLVAALGIGLASNIDGRSPLLDGFGLIAFASLFPMITVMVYGIITERFGVKSDTDIESEVEKEQKPEIVVQASSTINIDGSEDQLFMNLAFSGIAVIVPNDRKEDALHAAKDAGASGVTMLDAHGMGLNEMDNFYRYSHEASDTILLFLVPEKFVKPILDSIIHRLHITTTGDGIAFTFPLSQMKGISLRQQHIFEEEVSADSTPSHPAKPVEAEKEEVEIKPAENVTKATTQQKSQTRNQRRNRKRKR